MNAGMQACPNPFRLFTEQNQFPSKTFGKSFDGFHRRLRKIGSHGIQGILGHDIQKFGQVTSGISDGNLLHPGRLFRPASRIDFLIRMECPREEQVKRPDISSQCLFPIAAFNRSLAFPATSFPSPFCLPMADVSGFWLSKMIVVENWSGAKPEAVLVARMLLRYYPFWS